jgi:SAM-dependent methyltransferase
MHVASDSLERLVPDELREGDVTGSETLELHLKRYAFAAEHAVPGRLLDIACGVGYGTHLLAERVSSAQELVGVDLSPGAIAYAREHYGDSRISYVECDAMSFESPDGFDTIVSLETTEHLPEPRRFLRGLAALLRPSGRLIASVPTTPSVDINPHHLHDFNERSFRALLYGLPLKEIASLSQVQPVSLGDVVHRREQRLARLRPNLPQWYARHPGALLRRLGSTLRHGLANKYLTLVWQKCE